MEEFPPQDDFHEDYMLRRGIEKTIELIGEAIIDTALMVISHRGLEKPKDSRAAIKTLEKHNLLSPTLSPKIQDLISFRNLLVHRYANIDEDREYGSIRDDHEDILNFVEEMETFVKNEEKTPPKSRK